MAKKNTTLPSKASTPSQISFPVDLRYAPSFFPTVNVESKQILTIKKFFNETYTNSLIQSFEQIKLETTPLIKSREYAIRVNDRISINDPVTAANLWDYLQKILNNVHNNEFVLQEFRSAKGLNPQLRVYRYLKGHHFGKHYDESVKTIIPKGNTKWTLLIYLSGDDQLVGGDTIFYENREEFRVHPSKGMALLHKHGDDCLLHEAELVKDGVKWVLRSDVVF